MLSKANIEVVKSENESNASLIRRFTKRLQGSGILKHTRTKRFAERAESKYKKKMRALKRVEKQKETQRLMKLGRI